VLEDPELHILAAGGRILFALDQYGAAIGTVALRHEGNSVYELTKMAVGPDQRGAGVGRTLARAAVDLFVALEGTHLYLETNSRLGPAISLYESIGFEHRPRRPDSHYGRADVHMVWTTRPETSLVRRAVPTDAARLASVAAMTFPMACDPMTPPASINEFIRNSCGSSTQLSTS